MICVIGRTGSGKDSLVTRIAEKYNLNVLKSCTTRPKRYDDENSHYFIDDTFFDLHKDEIVAYTEINGYKYFALKSQIEDNDIYIIDPEGLLCLKDNNVDNLIAVYVYAPESLRFQRCTLNRKDNPNTFISRNNSEDQQFTNFELSHKYQYWIENIELNQAVKDFESILRKEGIIK